MSDLLGDKEEKILKSLRVLASTIREQASDLEAKLQSFETILDGISPKIRERLSILRKDVSISTQSIEQADGSLRERLEAAGKTLETHEQLGELLRALEDFNIEEAKRLMDKLGQNNVLKMESLQLYLEAVEQLQQDREFYQQVKRQLEAGGTLSKEQYNKLERFANNSLAQELLTLHRFNQLQASMKLEASSFHQRLQEYDHNIQEVRSKLAHLSQHFVSLESEAIRDKIDELNFPLKDDEIVSEAVRSWRRRLIALEEAYGQVSAVEKKLTVDGEPQDLETILGALRSLVLILRTSDVEIFTPKLKKAWSGAVSRANEALGNILPKNDKLSRESKQAIEAKREKIDKLKKEAEKKAEACRRIYSGAD